MKRREGHIRIEQIKASKSNVRREAMRNQGREDHITEANMMEEKRNEAQRIKSTREDKRNNI